MTYKRQVNKEHYDSEMYDNLARFISYFNQKEAVLTAVKKLTKPQVLEIGVGNGFIADYLKKNDILLETFDFSPELNPDIVGDVTKISSLVHKKYNIVCAFEILEHIKYEDQEATLKQLSEISTDYVLISLPQAELYFSAWFKINILKPFSLYLSFPFPTKHVFNGEHYWELGKKGYSIKKYRNLLSKYFIIESEFVHPLDTYHRFFITRNK